MQVAIQLPKIEAQQDPTEQLRSRPPQKVVGQRKESLQKEPVDSQVPMNGHGAEGPQLPKVPEQRPHSASDLQVVEMLLLQNPAPQSLSEVHWPGKPGEHKRGHSALDRHASPGRASTRRTVGIDAARCAAARTRAARTVLIQHARRACQNARTLAVVVRRARRTRIHTLATVTVDGGGATQEQHREAYQMAAVHASHPK